MTTEPVTAEAHLTAVADALNPLWRSNGAAAVIHMDPGIH
jgi:hypothetical protein